MQMIPRSVNNESRWMVRWSRWWWWRWGRGRERGETMWRGGKGKLLTGKLLCECWRMIFHLRRREPWLCLRQDGTEAFNAEIKMLFFFFGAFFFWIFQSIYIYKTICKVDAVGRPPSAPNDEEQHQETTKQEMFALEFKQKCVWTLMKTWTCPCSVCPADDKTSGQTSRLRSRGRERHQGAQLLPLHGLGETGEQGGAATVQTQSRKFKPLHPPPPSTHSRDQEVTFCVAG